MTDAERDLLRAVLESPDDDGPRLVYADLLDETDRAEQAEFIRQQIQHVNDPDYHGFLCLPERPCRNCDRESYLLNEHYKKEIDLIAKVIGYQGNLISNFVKYRRGFPDEIRCTLAEFMGGECRKCKGDGRRLNPATINPISCYISVSCPNCKGTGRIEGLAKRIGETWPVTKVVLTDRKPYRDAWGYQWWSDNRDESGVGAIGMHRKVVYHKTEKLAFDALSQESVSYMRSLANLPPLPGTVHQSTARAS